MALALPRFAVRSVKSDLRMRPARTFIYLDDAVDRCALMLLAVTTAAEAS
jgi:hypothetical protein